MAQLTVVKTLALGERRPIQGPVTRRRLRRFMCGLAFISAAAVVVSLATSNAAARAFALGLLLPGGGLAYGIDSPVLAMSLVIVNVLTLGIALLWWTQFGNILAPPLVILGSAGIAAATVGSEVRSGAVWVV